MIKQILSDKPTRLFLMLAGFFIANAMIAEFIGVKIFSLEDSRLVCYQVVCLHRELWF
jgi:hypothetical protein